MFKIGERYRWKNNDYALNSIVEITKLNSNQTAIGKMLISGSTANRWNFLDPLYFSNKDYLDFLPNQNRNETI